jgi:hypothetical protein
MPSKPSDQRAYVRIAVELPHHPKIAALDDPAAGWAYVVALCYCGEHLTDGVFPAAAILRTASASKTKADKLIRAGLWHGPEHDCPRCPQPPAGHAVIHDYLQHQHSQSYVRAVSQTRSAAGRKGATQRWQPNSKSHSNSHGPPLAPSQANHQQTAGGLLGNPITEVRR